MLTASIGDRARRAGRYSWAACAPAAAPRPGAAAGRAGSTAAGTSRARRQCARAALCSGQAVPVQETHNLVPGLVACEHTVSDAIDHFTSRYLIDASVCRPAVLLLENGSTAFRAQRSSEDAPRQRSKTVRSRLRIPMHPCWHTPCRRALATAQGRMSVGGSETTQAHKNVSQRRTHDRMQLLAAAARLNTAPPPICSAPGRLTA